MSEHAEDVSLPSSRSLTGDHLGLIVSATLSAFIVFKILAVAGWDPNTAKGIVEAGGTSNVLVGATIALLPSTYAFFIIVALPRLQERFQVGNRSAVERSAASMLETWPFVLLTFILPLYLVISVLALQVLTIATRVVRKRRTATGTGRPKDRVTRFEATAVVMSIVMWLLYSSLGSPWLATESVRLDDGKATTAYILSRDGDHVVALLDVPRKLVRLSATKLDEQFCTKPTSWFFRTLSQLGSAPDYPRCPG